MSTKETYLSCIDIALRNYINKTERKGYSPTIFTNLRHSFAETPDITKFRQDVNDAFDKDEIKRIIRYRLLTHPQNNHSYNLYLLDELIKQDEKWVHFNKRGILYYNKESVLYRGDMRPPADIFVTGFKAQHVSESIEDYASARSLSVGVSTTVSKSVAQQYSQRLVGARIKEVCPTVIEGYTYLIDPEGLEGIDIESTWKLRSRFNLVASWEAYINGAKVKKEINFKEIPPENIIGCFQGNMFFANKNYKKAIPVVTTSKSNNINFQKMI